MDVSNDFENERYKLTSVVVPDLGVGSQISRRFCRQKCHLYLKARHSLI